MTHEHMEVLPEWDLRVCCLLLLLCSHKPSYGPSNNFVFKTWFSLASAGIEVTTAKANPIITCSVPSHTCIILPSAGTFHHMPFSLFWPWICYRFLVLAYLVEIMCIGLGNAFRYNTRKSEHVRVLGLYQADLSLKTLYRIFLGCLIGPSHLRLD